MNKTKFLSILVMLLVVSNLALILFVLLRKPPRKEGPQAVIIERLHLDETQQKSYSELVKTHRKIISETQDSILIVKEQLYATLINPPKTNEKDSLVRLLGDLQIRIENTHYQHFIDLKKICRTEQQGYFEAFSKDITTLFPQQKLKGR